MGLTDRKTHRVQATVSGNDKSTGQNTAYAGTLKLDIPFKVSIQNVLLKVYIAIIVFIYGTNKRNLDFAKCVFIFISAYFPGDEC